MKYYLSSFLLAGLAFCASGAMAEDATLPGAKLAKQTCFSCHNFTDETRTKTGPNLHGIVGMTPATQKNFTRYSKELKEIGNGGAVWDEATLTEYLSDPTAFLRENSTNDKARSTMVFRKLTDEQVAQIVDYLETLK